MNLGGFFARQHLVLAVFLILVILRGVWWYHFYLVLFTFGLSNFLVHIG